MPRLAILQHAVMVNGGTCAFDAKGLCQITSHYDLVAFEQPESRAPEVVGATVDIAFPVPITEERLRDALWDSCHQQYFIASARLYNLIDVKKLLGLLQVK